MNTKQKVLFNIFKYGVILIIAVLLIVTCVQFVTISQLNSKKEKLNAELNATQNAYSESEKLKEYVENHPEYYEYLLKENGYKQQNEEVIKGK